MDLLRRQIAPVPDAAWAEIVDTVKAIYKGRIVGRRVVDVEGPLGWDHAAVGLGRLAVPEASQYEDVSLGIHQVLPLAEVRVFFDLSIAELDNAARGARDIELEPAEKAARRMAEFEDEAILVGMSSMGVLGIADSLARPTLEMTATAEGLVATVTKGVQELQEFGIEGPFYLVLGPDAHAAMTQSAVHYPVRKELRTLLGNGCIFHAPCFDGGLLVSGRGGDFSMTLGHDLSLGFESFDRDSVRLYLTESFTFRTLDENAALRLRVVQ